MAKESKKTNSEIRDNALTQDEINVYIMQYQEGKRIGDAEMYTDALNALYPQFESWVKSFVSKNYPTYIKNYWEDLYHQAWEGFMKALENYTLGKSAVTTHSSYYMKNACYEYICKYIHHTDTHRAGEERKIRETVEEMVKEGESPSLYQLSLLTGAKVAQVEKALAPTGDVSFDPVEGWLDGWLSKVDYVESPETQLIKNEVAEALHKVLKESLTKEEYIVFLSKHDEINYEGYPTTRLDVAKLLGISTAAVPQLYQNAITKIKMNPSLRALTFNRHEAEKERLLERDMGIVPINVATATMEELDNGDNFIAVETIVPADLTSAIEIKISI